MIRPDPTDAKIILDHFNGNEFNAEGKTISDIAAKSGGERSFDRANEEPTMIWTFTDNSTIHVDLETWTAKEGPHAQQK